MLNSETLFSQIWSLWQKFCNLQLLRWIRKHCFHKFDHFYKSFVIYNYYVITFTKLLKSLKCYVEIRNIDIRKIDQINKVSLISQFLRHGKFCIYWHYCHSYTNNDLFVSWINLQLWWRYALPYERTRTQRIDQKFGILEHQNNHSQWRRMVDMDADVIVGGY